MNNSFNPLCEFEFSPGEIDRARRHHRLLSMEIEFSLRCNFRCPYCYVPDKDHYKNELNLVEIKDVIGQAKTLGARKIIILGGEPSIYPAIWEMIRFIRQHDLEVEMFTNGTGITPDFAKKMFGEKVRVVLKMNSFDKKTQDRLSGKEGAFEVIQAAFSSLKTAGYPSNSAFMAVSTIICRQNIQELPKMWEWLRKQDIAPYFEIVTPQGNALENRWLLLSPETLGVFFQKIADIDREKFYKTWDIQPPLVGNRCMRHQFSCLVTSTGDVTPCVGITLPMGNIRHQPLEQILDNSPILRDLKDFRNTIKGPCKTCDMAEKCYGCRGTAFQMTGDYLASDPMCWRQKENHWGQRPPK